MSPLELQILIHYYGCANDFRDGDFSAPAVREAIDNFVKVTKLLCFDSRTDRTAAYVLTPKGRAYVKALCQTPLPVCVWTVPKSSDQLVMEEWE